MKIVKMSDVPKQPYAGSLFTGPEVTQQPLVSDSKDFRMAIVNFGKGVRNKFHTHDSDQILIVTAGKGIVVTDHEERMVALGDVIFIPAGEKHWHGATKDSDFSHISLAKAGSKMNQLEK